MTIKGFDYTSDSDGQTDWLVDVVVVANTTAEADFAGLGRGEVAGQVFEFATPQGLGGAMVQCLWSGFDDLFGTADDVTFTVVAYAAGSFDMAGVPYSVFTCIGRDPMTDRTAPAATATVFSPEVVVAALPLGPSADALAPPDAASLPNTGAQSDRVMSLALLTLTGGAGAVPVARRNPRRQHGVRGRVGT
ncbi:MAG: LPXTG cell wall anchor domain-containing protein [Ilumatobacteraceae bacterium]